MDTFLWLIGQTCEDTHQHADADDKAVKHDLKHGLSSQSTSDFSLAGDASSTDSQSEDCEDQLIPALAKDDSSTAADSSSHGDGTPTESQSEDGDAGYRVDWKTAVLPPVASELLTARWTFIHVDVPFDPSEDSDAHGQMRRRSMSAPQLPRHIQEAALDLAAAQSTEHMAAPTRGSCDVPRCRDETFAVGAKVVIQGLTLHPDFNGRAGLVQSWDPESRRYDVLLSDDTGSQVGRQAKLRAENLSLLPLAAPAVGEEPCDEAGPSCTPQWPSTPRLESNAVQATPTPQWSSEWTQWPTSATRALEGSYYAGTDWCSTGTWVPVAACWQEPICSSSVNAMMYKPPAR